ncbi:MAG: hypothetical protein J6128_00010 [Clostridia bacterium]|nr:hypothetical protein [Clostridia bacterium]
MKKTVCIITAILLLIGLASCGGITIPGVNGGSGGNGGSGSGQSGSVEEGKWPASVYSAYGIDEIETSGKIVYTEMLTEGSSQYEVYYNGVTREELVNWTDKLFEKGFRASDNAKDRIKNSYDYDTLIYLKDEKQPYRLHLSYDFTDDMSFEFYGDDIPAGVTVVEEKDDYGDSRYYVKYDLKVCLNPLKTAQSFEGTISALDLSAEDFEGVLDSLRAVEAGEGAFMSSVNFNFYSDHAATEEEIETLRTAIIDKLAAKGAKFYDGFDLDKEYTAEELKETGKSGYYVQKGDATFLLTVNPDSGYGDFGEFYGIVLTKKN